MSLRLATCRFGFVVRLLPGRETERFYLLAENTKVQLLGVGSEKGGSGQWAASHSQRHETRRRRQRRGAGVGSETARAKRKAGCVAERNGCRR